MSRKAEIIRGDNQTIPVTISSAWGDLEGQTAYLFVTSTTSTPPDTILDPSALITSTVGPITADQTSLDFELVSDSGQDNSSLIPIGTYKWYVRLDNAGQYRTVTLKPDTVEVVAPGDGDC